jgi:Tol biopolymer transport system component
MYYANGSGIRVRDTGREVDSALVAGATDVRAEPSPDRRRVALSYRQANTTNLIVVDGVSGRVSRVHDGPGNSEYTLAWSAAGDVLGIGYRAGTAGGILVSDGNGNLRDVGCSASNRFLAWRSNGQAVVSDDRNVYTVNTNDCGTLATLPMQGKSDITYAPRGGRVAFRRGGALFVAEHDGANAQQVTNARSNAANLRWSPDGGRLAFDVQSPQYANVTHIAIYDFGTGRATFNAEERALGMPRDAQACWSPNGRSLAHERAYPRTDGSGQSYLQRQKVVRPIPGSDEDVLMEELVRGTPDEDRWLCRWIDDDHLALQSNEGPLIYNVGTKTAYEMPRDGRLLYARVAN